MLEDRSLRPQERVHLAACLSACRACVHVRDRVCAQRVCMRVRVRMHTRVCSPRCSACRLLSVPSQWLFPMALAWLPGTVGLPVTDVSCFVLAPQFPRFLCHCWCQPLGCKRHRDRDSVRRRPAPTGVFTAAASRARGSASRREREAGARQTHTGARRGGGRSARPRLGVQEQRHTTQRDVSAQAARCREPRLHAADGHRLEIRQIKTSVKGT